MATLLRPATARVLKAVRRLSLRRPWGGPPARVALSLGSATLTVRVPGRETGLDGPSCVALDGRDGRMVAFGEQAATLDGRVAEPIQVVRPVQRGALAHAQGARLLLERALSLARRGWLPPSVVLGAPAGLTSTERRALTRAVRAAGARRVHLVDPVLLAALGSGLDLEEAEPRMVLDLGAGTSDIAVLAGGAPVASRSCRFGGDQMDEALRDVVRQVHGVELSAAGAERLKSSLAEAAPPGEERTATALGRDLRTGLPVRVTLTAGAVYEALKPVLEALADEVCAVLREIPADVAGDLAERGALLTGGVARMAGLPAFLEERTGLAMHRVDQPQGAVGRGLERLLREPELRRRLLAPPPGEPGPPLRGRTVALLLLALSLLALLLLPGEVRSLQPRVESALGGLLRPWTALVHRLTAPPETGALNPAMLQARLADAERRAALMARENQQLRVLTRAAPRPRGWASAPVTSAPVLGRALRTWRREFTLGAGARSGVSQGMVAVTADGVVGRVVSTSPEAGRLRLLADPGTVMGGHVPSRGASGVLYGMGDGTAELRYLDPDAGVRPGDRVITSGLDGLFPPDLPVGRVARVRRLDDVQEVATVVPEVRVDQVREVLLLAKGAGP